MKLPRGHLSPSSANAFERCQQQFKIFHVEGAISPPDCALEVKKQTHKTILEYDLAQKVTSKQNLGAQDLQEHFIQGLEEKSGLMKEDPNRTEDVEKAVLPNLQRRIPVPARMMQACRRRR